MTPLLMRQHLLQPPHIQQMTAGGAADEVDRGVSADRADDAAANANPDSSDQIEAIFIRSGDVARYDDLKGFAAL